VTSRNRLVAPHPFASPIAVGRASDRSGITPRTGGEARDDGRSRAAADSWKAGTTHDVHERHGERRRLHATGARARIVTGLVAHT